LEPAPGIIVRVVTERSEPVLDVTDRRAFVTKAIETHV
jgi:hypothetical protein